MAAFSGPHRALRLVYVSTLGTWAAFALVVVVLPFRFQQLGLSVVDYGVAIAVYALGTLLTESLWGFVAFRIGSSRFLGVLGVATAGSMLALGLARSFVVFSVLLGVYGMLVVYSTPLIRWVGMSGSGAGNASKGLGYLGFFFGAGTSAGTAVGPLLFSLGGFWLNVIVGAAVFLAATVPLLMVPWGSVALPRARTTGQSSVRAVLERRFVLAVVLVVLFFMSYSLVTNFLQYYSIGVFHGTVEEAGYVIGAARAAALLAGVAFGALVDRWGAHRAAPAGFLLIAGGALGLWCSHDYAEMTGFALVLAAGAGWLGVTLLPMALSHISPEHQGTGVGVFGSFEDLGLILGPILLGGVYATFGPRDVFPVTAALAVAGVLLALTARSHRTERPDGRGGGQPTPPSLPQRSLRTSTPATSGSPTGDAGRP